MATQRNNLSTWLSNNNNQSLTA